MKRELYVIPDTETVEITLRGGQILAGSGEDLETNSVEEDYE